MIWQVSRMDRKEAIEILKRNKPTSDPRRCGTELCEAVDMAIEALQEPERKKGHWITELKAEYWLQVYFKLKDYEDLEEQGRLVILQKPIGRVTFDQFNREGGTHDTSTND